VAHRRRERRDARRDRTKIQTAAEALSGRLRRPDQRLRRANEQVRLGGRGGDLARSCPDRALSASSRGQRRLHQAVDARPGTLLALRINAVDASVAEMSDWGFDEEGGISSVHPLPDGRLIVIPRSFELPDTEPAGIREPVFIMNPPSKDMQLLLQYCTHPGHFITQGDLLALDCAPEVFADYLVYAAFVFDKAGRRLAHIPRCRYPIWSGDRVIACRKLVWADGPAEHRLIRVVIRN
jgi:hypothetical protein